MLIREFRDADAAALVELFHATVQKIGLLHYSKKQVQAWSPSPSMPEDFIEWASDGRTVLVAISDEHEPIAYGDLESDGHIDHLYCRPDHVGRGVASAIYQDIEILAKERGIDQLFVEASETAKRLFTRHGFSVVRRNEFEVDGVTIHNYRMIKSI